MTKRWTALLLAALLALTLAGCAGTPAASSAPASSASAAKPAAKEITDMIGRKVQVAPGSYKRVVCIGAGALRMYSYVGDTALLCGVEEIDNTTLAERPKMFDGVARPYVMAYGDVFAKLKSCGTGGPNAQAAEAEKILACAPDIVISEYEDVQKEDALQKQLGVPVITLKAGPAGVFDAAFTGSMALLGEIFGRETKAKALTDYIAAEKAELTKRTAGVAAAEKPSVYICGLGNWGTTNHLMTTKDYSAFAAANIKNAVTELAVPGVGPIEKEKFVALGGAMDIMIIDAAAVKNIKPLYQADKTMFDSAKAWKNNEVYLQLAYNAYYTNFEINLLNAWFAAKSAYPKLFADIDMNKKTDEVTTKFLGQPLAQKINAAPQSFGGYQKIDTAAFFG